MEGRDFEVFQKKSERAKFLRLLTKRCVKRLNENLNLKNMKRKK